MSVETHAAELTSRGYRRISNKYGRIARIDRSDWRKQLDHRLRFASESVQACWEDHYRRMYTTDKQDVDPEIARLVPSSCQDYTGFIDDIPF